MTPRPKHQVTRPRPRHKNRLKTASRLETVSRLNITGSLVFSRVQTQSLHLHPSLSSRSHPSVTPPLSFYSSCSICILFLPLLGLPFVLSSNYLMLWTILSQNVMHPLEWFHFQTVHNIRPSSITFAVHSSLVTLPTLLILSILLHIHILKASNLCWSESTSMSPLHVALHSRLITS